jgi:predicted RNase H-like HicB family nuclease
MLLLGQPFVIVIDSPFFGENCMADQDVIARFFDVDGVSYRITERHFDGRYFVGWLCIDCHELTGFSLRGDTLEEALVRAMDCIGLHQRDKHVSASKPVDGAC